MISIIRRKINAKTLMGQSSALKSNTEFLKKNVGNLAKVLREKNKIKPTSLMGVKEKSVVEQKRIGPGEYEKKEGGGLKLPPLLPLLKGALIGGIALADPKFFAKKVLQAFLKKILKFANRLRKVIFGLFEFVGKTIKRIIDTFADIGKKIFDAIGDGAKKVKNFIDDKLLKPLREAFESALESEWFKKLRAFFDDIGTSIKTFIKNSVERFKTFADDVFTKVKTFVGDLVDRGIKAFNGVLDNIADKILKPLKEKVKQFVENAIKWASNTAGRILDPIVKPVVNAAEQTLKAGQETIVRVLRDTQDGLIDGLDNTIKPVTETPVIGGAVKPFYNLARDFISGPKSFLTKQINSLGAFGADFYKSVKKKGVQFADLIKSIPKSAKESMDFWANRAEDAKKLLTDLGQRGADLIKGGVANVTTFGKNVSSSISAAAAGAAEQIAKLDPNNLVKNALGSILESVQKNVSKAAIEPVSGMIKPLIENFTGFASNLNFLNPLIDAGRGIKGLADDALGFFKKLPGGEAFERGVREATGTFDVIFSLADAALSYGIAVDTQRKAEEAGMDPKKAREKARETLKGQGEGLGTALLRAAAGFGGSAIGSGLGSVIPGAGTFLGGLVGGLIGEELGLKLAESLSSQHKGLIDPFGIPVFTKPDQNDMVISNLGKWISGLFGGGDKEEAPQGGIYASGLPPRNFDLLQTEMDYNVKTEVIVMKSKEVISNSAVATAGSSGGGGSTVPIILRTGGSALNNYKSKTLAQLS